MWNSGWNTTLTLIHRRPDSIVLQPNTNKYLFLSKYNNHPEQRKHDSNRPRNEAPGTPNPFTRIALTTKWTTLTRDVKVIVPRAVGPHVRTTYRKTTLPAKHALTRNPEWDHTNLCGTHASLDVTHGALQINTTKQHASHTWNLNELPSGIQLIQRCHVVIPDTSVKQTTRNKRKERHATTRNATSNPAKKNCCRSTQIWKQNWESFSSRDTCLNHCHTGCVVEHRADLLGKTWYKNWRLDPHRRCRCDKRWEIKSATRDPPPPNTQTHFHELIHRTTIISWKKKPTPLKLTTGHFQFAANKIGRNVSRNNQQRIRSHNLPLQTRNNRLLKRYKTNMKTKHNETSLSISPHEPGSNSQPTIFAPNNEGRNKRLTECLKKTRRINTRRRIVHETTSWPDRNSHSVNHENAARNTFPMYEKRENSYKNPSTMAFPNPTRTWMTHRKMEVM